MGEFNKHRFCVENFVFEISDILEIAKNCGEEILAIYQDNIDVKYKSDKSPFTLADRRSHDIIIQGLKGYGLPVLSEEGKEISFKERQKWNLFWMIDPLDGTKEFVNRNGEFTVNIALLHNNKPIFGVVHVPYLRVFYYNDMYNAYKIENNKQIVLPIKRVDEDKLVIVSSRSHLNQETKSFIKSIRTSKEKVLISIGSSLKICLVVEGKADIYPRLAPTMEWDTAAADAIARKIGKALYSVVTNQPLQYNKENLRNDYFVLR